jgi:hypothetical protein
VSTEHLEAKVVALRAEIADKIALVETTKANRDADLARRDETTADAEEVVSAMEDLALELELEAGELEANADEILRVAQENADRLRQQAIDLAENIEAIPDDSLRALAVTLMARECCEEHWREQLARVQDGHLRRKTAQLEKLERRLATRCVSQARGTGRPEVENAKRSTAKQYRLTLKQYAEVRARNLFQHPRYKGPPEWAFLKAIDDLEKQLSPEEIATIQAAVKADAEAEKAMKRTLPQTPTLETKP